MKISGRSLSVLLILCLLPAKITAQEWTTVLLDSAGMRPNLALDSEGNPVIPYVVPLDIPSPLPGRFSRFVNLARWNSDSAGFVIERVDSAVIDEYVDIAVDFEDKIHLTYHHHDDGNVRYAFNDGTGWIFDAITTVLHDGWISSIDVDQLGNPHVSFMDPACCAQGDGIEYATSNGVSWIRETIGSDSLHNSIYIGTSLIVNQFGEPAIAYYNDLTRDLMYAQNQGGIWTITAVDTAGDVGRFPSMKLDLEGNPRISYYERLTDSSGVIKYAFFDGLNWTTANVDVLTDVSGVDLSGIGSESPLGLARNMTALAIDATGVAHIVYSDTKRLRRATIGDNSAELETVVNHGSSLRLLGQSVFHEIDDSAGVHLTYFEIGNLTGSNTLNYAWYGYYDGANPSGVVSGPSFIPDGAPGPLWRNDTLFIYTSEYIDTTSQTFEITSTGNIDLDGFITTGPQPWLFLSDTVFNILPSITKTIEVKVMPAALGPGTYYANLGIESNSDDSPQIITVAVFVLEEWAKFESDITSIPPGRPILVGDTIRNNFTFINHTNRRQPVRIWAEWLRHTGEKSTLLSTRSIDIFPFELNANRSREYRVPESMPEGTNWVISWLTDESGLDTVYSDTAEFEVTAASESLLDNMESTVPRTTALLQNYPNPFNPATVIRYQLSVAGSVSLRIYDVSGRLARELVSEFASAAEYSVSWNGTNDHGERVGSGIYFYRFSVDGEDGSRFVDVRKMLLAR